MKTLRIFVPVVHLLLLNRSLNPHRENINAISWTFPKMILFKIKCYTIIVIILFCVQSFCSRCLMLRLLKNDITLNRQDMLLKMQLCLSFTPYVSDCPPLHDSLEMDK